MRRRLFNGPIESQSAFFRSSLRPLRPLREALFPQLGQTAIVIPLQLSFPPRAGSVATSAAGDF